MKKIFILISTILFVIAVYFIFFNSPPKSLSSQQRQKALSGILGRNPVLNVNTATGDVLYKGKYMSFMYPAAANIYKRTVNGRQVQYSGDLDYFSFDTQSPRLTLVSEVIQAPKSVLSVNDYPAVRLRQIESGTYHQSQLTADSQNGLAFDKGGSSGFEKTGFFYLNSKIYSFSVTGSDSKNVQDLFNKIMTTLKFL